MTEIDPENARRGGQRARAEVEMARARILARRQVRQTLRFRGRPTSVGRSIPQSAITQTQNRHLMGELIPYVIRAFVYIRFVCLFV